MRNRFYRGGEGGVKEEEEKKNRKTKTSLASGEGRECGRCVLLLADLLQRICSWFLYILCLPLQQRSKTSLPESRRRVSVPGLFISALPASLVI